MTEAKNRLRDLINRMAGEKNMWKDKLSNFSLPDEKLAWQRMELLLDRHMPVRKNGSFNGRYIPALFLFMIGVQLPIYKKNKKQ